MPAPGTLRVIDAAEDFAVDVNHCFSGRARGRSKHHAEQVRRAAASVCANLIEGFARGPGPDRIRLYRIARAECEEALGWLRLSHRISPLPSRDFFRLSNRGIVISRMISRLKH
jgi:four helix bundle protein